MARCEGKTRKGDRCKRTAQPDSKFCYLHDTEMEAESGDADGGEATAEELEFVDLVPILMAGLLATGVVFLLKGFGKWIPRL